MMFMLMISHDREPHLIIGVAALHHHARNSCIVTHDQGRSQGGAKGANAPPPFLVKMRHVFFVL